MDNSLSAIAMRAFSEACNNSAERSGRPSRRSRRPQAFGQGDQGVVEFEVSDIGAAVKVALHGRLDAPSVDRIETSLLASIVPGGKHTVVDLAGVTFVSSLGVRMLFSATQALRLRQAKLVLYAAQPLVAESLNLVIKQIRVGPQPQFSAPTGR